MTDILESLSTEDRAKVDRLARDLAAYSNRSTEDALDSIRAIARAEPLRPFGVSDVRSS